MKYLIFLILFLCIWKKTRQGDPPVVVISASATLGPVLCDLAFANRGFMYSVKFIVETEYVPVLEFINEII